MAMMTGAEIDSLADLVADKVMQRMAVDLPASLLTYDELATKTGLTRRKIETLKSQKKIPFIQDGKTVRFEAEAVLSALRRLTEGNNN